MFRRERDMREPVRAWMEAEGYIVHDESHLWSGGIPDLLGCQQIHLGYAHYTYRFVAVELKLRHPTRALDQACAYSPFVHAVYAAFPEMVAYRYLEQYRTRIEGDGTGILAVTPERSECIHPACLHHECACFPLWKRFEREWRKRDREAWDSV